MDYILKSYDVDIYTCYVSVNEILLHVPFVNLNVKQIIYHQVV
jgi:hypothetical protein